MLTGPSEPFVGYDLAVTAGNCFNSMLCCDAWITIAQKNGAGSDPETICNLIASYAILAAKQIQSAVEAAKSQY